MRVTLRLTKNTGPRFAPVSRVFGPFDRIEIDTKCKLVGTLDGKETLIAWEDYDGWYCDMDGDAYRSFTVEVASCDLPGRV